MGVRQGEAFIVGRRGRSVRAGSGSPLRTWKKPRVCLIDPDYNQDGVNPGCMACALSRKSRLHPEADTFERSRPSLVASADTASGSPNRMSWAKPLRATPAAARSTRASMPSGRTMRCGWSSHRRLMWCMKRLGVTTDSTCWVCTAWHRLSSCTCLATRCCTPGQLQKL